jgi:hypothetical protein
MEYREKNYRKIVSNKKLAVFNVKIKETDLYISADESYENEAIKSVYKYRKYVEEYIAYNRSFLNSLAPIAEDKFAPAIIREMIKSSQISGVGPMASVAGAIAQYTGLDLLECSKNIIIENGGDIFLKLDKDDACVGIFAGKSPLSYKIAVKVKSKDTPLGVCTSSGTVGHSLSLGVADAVCITSKSAVLADAAATSICNYVKGKGDIEMALDRALSIEGVLGVVIIVGDKLGACGAIELV